MDFGFDFDFVFIFVFYFVFVCVFVVDFIFVVVFDFVFVVGFDFVFVVGFDFDLDLDFDFDIVFDFFGASGGLSATGYNCGLRALLSTMPKDRTAFKSVRHGVFHGFLQRALSAPEIVFMFRHVSALPQGQPRCAVPCTLRTKHYR